MKIKDIEITQDDFLELRSLGNSIGIRIKTLRVSRGVSIDEFAQKSNISKTRLELLEKDKVEMSFEEACTICRVWNLSMNFLLMGIRDDLTDKGLCQ